VKSKFLEGFEITEMGDSLILNLKTYLESIVIEKSKNHPTIARTLSIK